MTPADEIPGWRSIRFTPLISSTPIRRGDHFGLSAQIEKGHRSTLLCHLGNIAYRTQRMLKCNPENGHILDDAAAMALLAARIRTRLEAVRLEAVSEASTTVS